MYLKFGEAIYKFMGDEITGLLRLEDCVELCTPKSLFTDIS